MNTDTLLGIAAVIGLSAGSSAFADSIHGTLENNRVANETVEAKTITSKREPILMGGTGALKDARGSSDMVIRSTVSALVYGLGSGSEIAIKNGIMILPKLTYTVPGQ